jgi:hypothetical protein
MIQRCYNPKRNVYKYYGLLGVTVSDEWFNFETFCNDMKEKPNEKLTLDRINPYGNYSKENCRWATRTEQYYNTRSRYEN